MTINDGLLIRMRIQNIIKCLLYMCILIMPCFSNNMLRGLRKQKLTFHQLVHNTILKFYITKIIYLQWRSQIGGIVRKLDISILYCGLFCYITTNQYNRYKYRLFQEYYHPQSLVVISNYHKYRIYLFVCFCFFLSRQYFKIVSSRKNTHENNIILRYNIVLFL